VKGVLTIALPKGRVLRAVAPLLAEAGADTTVLLADDRTLVRESPAVGLRFLLLKPDDVPTYVEYGAADLGVCGCDVLLERLSDVYQPLDLADHRPRGCPASRRSIRESPRSTLRGAASKPTSFTCRAPSSWHPSRVCRTSSSISSKRARH
jgi:ATP phosphoribosyltransferase